jgi:hypothetical protein
MTRRIAFALSIALGMIAAGTSGCSSCGSGAGTSTGSGDAGEMDSSVSADSGQSADSTVGSDAADSAVAVEAGDATTGGDSATGSDASDARNGCSEAGASCGANMVCTPGGQCVACTEGAACTPDAGAVAECETYAACAGGVVACAASGAANDGTSCGDAGGTCTRGSCAPDVTLGADGGVVDLSTTTITPGRTCADSQSYAVTGLTSTTATLGAAPNAGCLAAGDEVLLINLQGTPTATPNIGVFELLTVQTTAGATVTFTTAKVNFYGQDAGDDTNIGTGAGQQRVAIVRIPRFGALTISSGATLTSGAWNGQTGGVMAVRANAFTIDGTVSAYNLGYRDGFWSQDSACALSTQTQSGESITGRPTPGDRAASVPARRASSATCRS